MAANFADPPPRRTDWSSRTADLDSSTTDLHEEQTSDLTGVRTEDFDAAGSISATPKVVTAAASRNAPSESVPRAQSTIVVPSAPAAAAANRAHLARNLSEMPASVRDVGPGTVLNDRFLIEKHLGQGGTATVFCARDLHARDGRSPTARVAIKVPTIAVKDPERAISRLQHEFRHAQTLQHSNIVRVLALDNDHQTWFMTMELIEGKSLSAVLRDRQWLSDVRKLAILRSCADALSFAHRHQVVHGDFKPANVLITADGQAKVFDFGAAAATSGEDTRIPAGTPAYASPQVLNGDRPDARDDVFSFACVAYEVLTGEHPFGRRSSIEAREQAIVPQRAWTLSAEQWLALLAALSWEREQRPASVDALMGDLTAPSNAQIEPAAQIEEAPLTPASEIAEEIVPAQRSWGFFSFVLIALAIGLLFMLRESSETSPTAPESNSTLANQQGNERRGALEPSSTADSVAHPSFMSIMPMTSASDQKLFGGQLGGEGPAVDDASKAEEAMNVKPEKPAARAAAPVSTMSFAQERIETPEGSIAAVFIVTRSPPLTGRASVNWQISGGSASIDEDFIASASGTVHFADGQSQRAIYIPLRNDLDAEGDETFSLELGSPQRGRIGSISRVEATIRDDD